ncbi:MAG: pyridoxamine 5'-phosphate oxidase family protein [Nitrospinae bacterium]|nr:pyridoxamine 5'-phosphate oxidase family protein [Nitrospinota bacterium]
MRREDFAGQNEELDFIFASAIVGELGITDSSGFPRVIPVNFAWHEGAVYFHGAGSGEKFELLTNGPKVTFMAYLTYSSVPSYWRSPKYACPASIYYKSAYIKGRGSLVENPAEKADALNVIMQKYQPEGGYSQISADDPLYKNGLAETAVFKILPETAEVKNKMGQNLPPETKKTIIEKLVERGTPLDILTAEEMRKVDR